MLCVEIDYNGKMGNEQIYKFVLPAKYGRKIFTEKVGERALCHTNPFR